LRLTLLDRAIEPPDIGARAEGRIGSGNYQHTQSGVLSKAVDFSFELLAQLPAERVAGGGIM